MLVLAEKGSVTALSEAGVFALCHGPRAVTNSLRCGLEQTPALWQLLFSQQLEQLINMARHRRRAGQNTSPCLRAPVVAVVSLNKEISSFHCVPWAWILLAAIRCTVLTWCWSLYALIIIGEKCTRDTTTLSGLWSDFVAFILPLHVSAEGEPPLVTKGFFFIYSKLQLELSVITHRLSFIVK